MVKVMALLIWVVSICTMGALCCLSDRADGALQIFSKENYIPSAEVMQRISEQRNAVFLSLFKAIEDKNFRQSLRENMLSGFENGTSQWAKSYCMLSIIECFAHEVTRITLSGMDNGRLHFAHFPKTLKSLKVVQSTLDQALRVEEIPPILDTIEFHGVRFTSDEAVVSPAFASLRTFICRDCDLRKVSFGDVKGLENVDLGSNPLPTIPVNLPLSVVSLGMENTSLAMPLEQFLKLLPSSVHSLDVGYSGITNVLDGFEKMPLHFRRVAVSGNPVNASMPSVVKALTGVSGTLKDLIMGDCNLEGTVYGMRHMKSLLTLNLSHNRIFDVEWEELPRSLVAIDASCNELSGVLSTKSLPRQLTLLNISSNSMTGNIGLSDLPGGLNSLDVSHNHFSGNINLTRLPEGIEYIYIQGNHFEGTPNLVDIPVGIRHILIYDNNWDSLFPQF